MRGSLLGPDALAIGSHPSRPLELLNLVPLAIGKLLDHIQDCLLLRSANLYELHDENDFTCRAGR